MIATFVTKLLNQLEQDLEKISPDSGPVKRYELCKDLVKKAIEEVEQIVDIHLTDEEAEIFYFKEAAPKIYGLYFYYNRLCNLELHRITDSIKAFKEFLNKEMENVCSFLDAHSDLHRYYYSADSHHDRLLFLKTCPNGYFDEIAIVIHSKLCANSYRLAQLHASRNYLVTLSKLQQEIQALPAPPATKLKLKITKADVVELLAAMCADESFELDSRPAALADLKAFFEAAFDLDLKDIGVIDNKNRGRKKEDTPYLSRLISKYNARRDHLLG